MPITVVAAERELLALVVLNDVGRAIEREKGIISSRGETPGSGGRIA